MSKGRFSKLIPICFVGVAVATVCLLFYIPEHTQKVVLSAVLLVQISFVNLMMYKKMGALYILSPLFLVSVFHFFLGYVSPIFLIPLSEGAIDNAERWIQFVDIDPWIHDAQFLSIVSFTSFSLGYVFFLNRPISAEISRFFEQTKLVRKQFRINYFTTLLLTLAASVAIAIQIRMGVFGYMSNYESLLEDADSRRLLSTVGDGLIAGLFLLSIDYFRRKKARERSTLVALVFTVVLIACVFVGLLSGFKGSVLAPIIICGVAYFIVFRRIPAHFVSLAVVMLFVAYLVIEPLRFYKIQNPDEDYTNVGVIVTALVEGQDYVAQGEFIHDENPVARALTRMELLSFTAATLRRQQTDPVSKEFRAPFFEALVLSPVLAFVPRFMWEGKPIYQFGYWYAQEVLNEPPHLKNSVAMGAISYFYFMGGVFGVVTGFFFAGIFMSIVFKSFTSLGAGGWLIYLPISTSFAFFPSEVGPALIGCLMTLPVAGVFQFIALRNAPETFRLAKNRFRQKPSWNKL